MAGGYSVLLKNGAKAEDIFWQVSGYVNIGLEAHMEGTILTATAATFTTGSTLNGRIYAQTAVTLQMAIIACPTAGTCSVNLMDSETNRYNNGNFCTAELQQSANWAKYWFRKS
jgi:hypothetical protein